jgi:hypothetical protein
MPADARPILRIRSPIIGRGEQVFELSDKVVTIGRAEDCDVVLLEQSASRVHARLVPDGEGWTLVDEDSHAGVFVGTQRVRRQKLDDGARFRIGETDFQLVMRPGSLPTLVGATRPPADDPPLPSIGIAPTLASDRYPGEPHLGPMPSEISTAPMERAPPPAEPALPRPAPPRPDPPPPPMHAPIAVPIPVVPPRRGPPPSAPSFVDFGPVGRPEHGGRQGDSFTGELVDDPSRIAQVDGRVTSRFGTWIVVVLLFVGMSLLVLALAYDITFSDVMAVFE